METLYAYLGLLLKLFTLDWNLTFILSNHGKEIKQSIMPELYASAVRLKN